MDTFRKVYLWLILGFAVCGFVFFAVPGLLGLLLGLAEWVLLGLAVALGLLAWWKIRAARSTAGQQATQATVQPSQPVPPRSPVLKGVIYFPLVFLFLYLGWLFLLVPAVKDILGVSENTARIISLAVLLTPIPAWFIALGAEIFGIKAGSEIPRFYLTSRVVGMVLVIVFALGFVKDWTGKKPGEIPGWIKDWGQEQREKRLGRWLGTSPSGTAQAPQITQTPTLEVSANAGQEKESVRVGPGKDFNIWSNKPFVLWSVADQGGSRGPDIEYPAGWESFVGATRAGKLMVRGLEDETTVKFFQR